MFFFLSLLPGMSRTRSDKVVPEANPADSDSDSLLDTPVDQPYVSRKAKSQIPEAVEQSRLLEEEQGTSSGSASSPPIVTEGPGATPVSYTHLTLPTNREV